MPLERRFFNNMTRNTSIGAPIHGEVKKHHSFIPAHLKISRCVSVCGDAYSMAYCELPLQGFTAPRLNCTGGGGRHEVLGGACGHVLCGTSVEQPSLFPGCLSLAGAGSPGWRPRQARAWSHRKSQRHRWCRCLRSH